MENTVKRILIAEDERAMASALKTKLSSEGYEVVVVGDGQKAIDALKGGAFNLMLLDLMMPVLDGFGVLEKIKTEKIKAPPILVSTNLSQAEDKEKVKTLGASGFFVKSDTPISEVVERVKKALA